MKSSANSINNHQKSFAKEITALGREMSLATGSKDIKQFQKMRRWSLAASAFGYATAWIAPNPISIFLIAIGNFTRWSAVFHGISHGVFDSLPSIPERFKSKKFAKGLRRFIDWPDWILPEYWEKEHNHLHHHFTGAETDPDIVWRNTRHIRELNVPLFIKYFLVFVVSLIWKPFYYAPNTIVESWAASGKIKSNLIDGSTWSPFTPIGRQLWFRCLLPYIIYRFVLLPSLFLLHNPQAAVFVLVNTVLAELLANFLGFAAIATNHTGNDIPLFSTPVKSKEEYFRRQVEGSVNLPTGSELRDFLFGGLNYQIEHHLWPKATLLQYQNMRPKLREICKDFGITYREESLYRRLKKTFEIIVGAKKPLIVEGIKC